MQQKFQFHNKNLNVLGIWFNSFYFATLNSTFDTGLLCFFVITVSAVAVFVLDESFSSSNSLS